MRISSLFAPFFALLAGAGGLYFRVTELLNVFDRQGLPERGAGITIALIVFSALFLLVDLLFSLRVSLKHTASAGFENAFGTDALSYPMVFSAIGIVWLGATVKHYFDLRTLEPFPRIELIFLALSGLSAVALALFAIETYQDPRRKIIYALSIVPTLFMCFWLIVLYRQNSSNPVLLGYLYQCLAITSAALGFYFTSGFVYEKPAPGKAVFTYLASIYFCFVTLADGHSTSISLIFAAIIVTNVLSASMLIRNLKWKSA